MNELVRKEAHLATLQAQNKLNILAITPSAPPFNLSVPGVFHVPDLSYNLCSVGQLAELGYRHIFYYSGCIVQDPRRGQELGTDPKVGCMFPMDNLHLPVVHQLACPGTSQQNGRAEQKFRHILDTIRALLLSAKVPAHFWGKAALHAVHVVYAINRIPSPIIQNQAPNMHLFWSSSNYHHLHSSGFACFVLLQLHEQNKLKSQSKLCCFLGYGETQKGVSLL